MCILAFTCPIQLLTKELHLKLGLIIYNSRDPYKLSPTNCCQLSPKNYHILIHSYKSLLSKRWNLLNRLVKTINECYTECSTPPFDQFYTFFKCKTYNHHLKELYSIKLLLQIVQKRCKCATAIFLHPNLYSMYYTF